MIKINRTPEAPKSLESRKSYTEPDVIALLQHDFYNKCYICGYGELPDINVEHLLPHHNGEFIERKYDWNNLFLSCPHCNSVKNRKKYEQNIIDCCRTDPDLLIDHRVDNDRISVSCRQGIDTAEARTTSELIQDCFELRNTGIRTAGAEFRAKQLRITKLLLEQNLTEYSRSVPGTQQRERLFRTLRGMVSRKAKFSGFMRTYIRDHRDEYPEIFELIRPDCDV